MASSAVRLCLSFCLIISMFSVKPMLTYSSSRFSLQSPESFIYQLLFLVLLFSVSRFRSPPYCIYGFYILFRQSLFSVWPPVRIPYFVLCTLLYLFINHATDSDQARLFLPFLSSSTYSHLSSLHLLHLSGPQFPLHVFGDNNALSS